MAGPAFRAAGAVSSGNTPLSLAVPAGVQSGDLLVAAIFSNSSGGTTPSGWTRSVFGGSTRWLYIYTRTATGSEPTSYSFTTGATFDVGVMVAYVNAVVDVAGTAIQITGTTCSGQSVTTTGPDRTVVGFYGVSNSGVTITLPAGMTSEVAGGGSSPELSVGDIQQATAGATGNYDATLSSGQINVGALLALKNGIVTTPISVSATCTTTVSRTRSITRRCSATCNTGVVVSFGRAFLRAVAATCSTSAGISRSVGVVRRATVTTSVVLQRIRAATVHSTVLTEPALVRAVGKSLAAGVTTSATAALQFIRKPFASLVARTRNAATRLRARSHGGISLDTRTGSRSHLDGAP